MLLNAKDVVAGGYRGSVAPRGDGEEIALLPFPSHYPLNQQHISQMEDKFSQL